MIPKSFQACNDQQPSFVEHALAYGRTAMVDHPRRRQEADRIVETVSESAGGRRHNSATFCQKGITGLAVVLGRVSGGLAVRDFDDADAYHQWADAHPEDAKRLPTSRTGRGFHVFGRLDTEDFVNFDDGELRADSRHIVVLPPSLHPNGEPYAWLNPLPDISTPLPLLSFTLTQGQSRRQHKEDPVNTPPDTHNSLAPPLVSQILDNPQVHDAIRRTIPDGVHQRHRRLFDLARILKYIIPNAPSGELRLVVRHWHQLALPFIATKEFSATWSDFVAAWQCVKHPAGRSFKAAADAASGGPVPAVVAELGYDGDLRLLASLCWQLQLHWGNQPFPLGCRTACKFLDNSKSEANRLLNALQFDGVLRLVSKGSKTTGKASEWRFLTVR